MRKSLSLFSAAAAALWGCATASPPPAGAGEETAIPFISSLNNVEWKRINNRAVYIRGGNGDWYLVRTTNRCTRLAAASALGFETSALNQLDRFGALLVQGQRCPVASVTRSDPPPEAPRR